jgi:ankyrin repeat protein
MVSVKNVALKSSETSYNNTTLKEDSMIWKNIRFSIAYAIFPISMFFLGCSDSISDYICQNLYNSASSQLEKNLFNALANGRCGCSPSELNERIYQETKARHEKLFLPLLEAVVQNDTAKARSLLSNGSTEVINKRAEATESVPAGTTLLMLASANGNVNMVKLLLSNGAAVDAQDDSGTTALIYASWKGKTDVVKTLIENGANISTATNDGRTALGVAQQTKNSAIVNLLRSKTSAVATK